DITDLPDFIEMKVLYERLVGLNMAVYSPFDYILSNKQQFYGALYDKDSSGNLSQANREKGIQLLMTVNLLKRLESSVDSFRITLGKYIKTLETTITSIEDFERTGESKQTEFTDLSNVSLD